MLPVGWNQIRQVRTPDQIQQFTSLAVNPQMMGNMAQQPFGIYQQQFMHPRQMFQQQMMGSFMSAPPPVSNLFLNCVLLNSIPSISFSPLRALFEKISIVYGTYNVRVQSTRHPVL